MDRIFVNDLTARCIIGVNEDERREKQDVVINLEICADQDKPCRSDRFEDSLDYRVFKKRILQMVEGSPFTLVEAMAPAVADICLADPRVAQVTVRVEKPGALRFARSVGVEITRARQK